MKHIRNLVLGAMIATAGGVGSVVAADLFVPPPPPPLPEKEVGCLYLRGDTGVRFHQRPKVSKVHGTGQGSDNAFGEKLKSNAFVEGGAGCQFTENLRGDVTVGYRFRSTLKDGFHSLDAKHSVLTGFANLYYDIADFDGIVPYVGGGVGVAHHWISDVKLPVNAGSGTHVSFAWNVQAGVAFAITETLMIDVGYRYTDLGKAKSGGENPFQATNMVSHDVRIGLRVALH